MLVLTGMVAMAQTSVWNGGKALWTRGTGTETDPYLIESADQLAGLAYIVNKGYNTAGMHFRLTTDVDLNGSEDLPWFPIGLGNRWFSEDGCDRGPVNAYIYDGESRPYFRGHFDGGNHCVFNIYIEDESNAGLFGAVQSMGDSVVIENVFVVSGTIEGSTCGGVVGRAQGNVVVSHCGNSATIFGNAAAGGIVGNGSSQVIDCYNEGDVTGKNAGGIVAEQANLVDKCYNNGSVEGGESGAAGGIVGYGYSTRTINNSYNTGAISAMGGESGDLPAVGGLIGLARNCTITYSFNVGELSCTNHLGCLIGYAMGTPVVEHCYYLNTCNQSEFGEPLDETMMHSQAFVDLLNNQNPDPVWTYDENNLNDGFPVLDEYVLSLEVTANPIEGGVVEGSGTYRFGTMATLTATANDDYLFVNWTGNGEVLSTEPTYSFIVTASGNYVANFMLNSFEVTAEAQPADGGEITGTGTYQYGASATLIVTPNPEYQLNYWSKDGEIVSEELSYTFVVTEDCHLVANLIPAGVSEEHDAVLKIYPNPTHGKFTVEGTGRMTVTNLLGQTLLIKDVDGKTTVEMPSGTYFVKIDGVTQKVVVE